MTKAQYLSWFDEVLQPTEPTFRRVPSDKLEFRLTERGFTVGQLLSHIPASLRFFSIVLNNEEPPLKSMREILVANRRQGSATVEEGVRYLTSATHAFKQSVEKLTEDQFQNDLLDTPQKGRVHYWRYCAFAIEHHIHHLMELHLSLKVLGVDVNTQSLYVG
jgi:uncharacterized damage-inducible protein DinB